MSEHLLDEADVGAAFEHQRGHGVAEQVTGAVFADTGSCPRSPNQLGEVVRMNASPALVEKDRPVIWLDGQLRAAPHAGISLSTARRARRWE